MNQGAIGLLIGLLTAAPPKPAFDQFAIEAAWGEKVLALVAEKRPAVIRTAAMECFQMAQRGSFPSQLHRKRWRVLGEIYRAQANAKAKRKFRRATELALLGHKVYELDLDFASGTPALVKQTNETLDRVLRSAKDGFPGAAQVIATCCQCGEPIYAGDNTYAHPCGTTHFLCPRDAQ